MVLSRYYELLKEYIEFNTIQDSKSFSKEAELTMKWLNNLLKKQNFDIQEYSVDDCPILIAKQIQNQNLPTCLIYTNYDLELQEISPEWKNNPFHLYLGKDEVIGRGVAENKGQFIIYLASILELIEQNKLGYNIIFLIDGTQNKVGANLTEFLKKHQSSLASDFCLFGFGEGVGESPTLEIGQRGGINFDIIFSKEDEKLRELNPNLEMIKMLNKLYNMNNKIAIPYFYYNVEKTQPELKEIRRYGTNLEYRTISVPNTGGNINLEPTLEITGLISLPKFEKTKSIPKTTSANLHMKIVNRQNYQEIINGLQQRLKYSIPQNLKTQLIIHEAYNPCKYNINNAYTQKATTLLSSALHAPLQHKQNPIGIKAAEAIQNHICPNIISLPLATEGSNIGIANEHLTTERIKKLFDFCLTFFSS